MVEKYYYAIVAIAITAIGIVVYHLLRENDSFSRRIRCTLGEIGIFIILCTLLEVTGRLLDGNQSLSTLHGLVKAAEFSLAPFIPLEFSKVVEPNLRKKKQGKVLIGVLSVNCFLEFISVIVPGTFFIDENFVYKRATYYPIYVATYLLAILYLINEIRKYNNKYQSSNISLVAMVVFLIGGLSIRLVNYSIYTDWLVVSVCYVMFIVNFADTYGKTDALTGLLIRKAFKNRLKQIDYDTAIIIIDANHFKLVNDEYGHPVGDLALKIIARHIRHIYGRYAYCYRLGGDEFAVVFKEGELEQMTQETGMLDDDAIRQLNKELDEIIKKESEKEETEWLKYGLSEGVKVYHYDKNDDDDALQYTYKLADEDMYADKKRKKME